VLSQKGSEGAGHRVVATASQFGRQLLDVASKFWQKNVRTVFARRHGMTSAGPSYAGMPPPRFENLRWELDVAC